MLAVALSPSASVQASVVIGGNSLDNRPVVDAATAALFFDLNGPISTDGVVESFSIFASSAQSGVGQLRLKIFHPNGNTWNFVGESPVVTVATWGAVNSWTLPAPIPVQAGDLIAFWYPPGTVPSITYTEPSDGSTINNRNWPDQPDVDFHGDIPNLLTNPNSFGTQWDVNPRIYSINVSGVPELGSFVLMGAVGISLLLFRHASRVERLKSCQR